MKRTFALLAVFMLVAGVIAMAGPAAAHTADAPYVTQLIAGGGSEASAVDVGEVRVWNDADHLYVKYVVDSDLTPDDYSDDGVPTLITETHLAIGTDLADLPQTRKGNPIPGRFEYSTYHDPGVTEYTYMIPLTWDLDTELYLAAHAVVEKAGGLAGLELALPDVVTMQVVNPGSGFGHPSYFDVTISGGTLLDGTYDDYCVDTDLTISPGTSYTAQVYSSYEALPAGLVDMPENLDLVNWIINQGFEGTASPVCDGVYTYGDVQRAIWALVEDAQSTSGLGPWSQCRVDEILAEAEANGEGFVPGCGDQVAVILVPIDPANAQVTIAQVTFAEALVPCYDLDETAWGGGFDFPGRNWGTYFGYTIQGELDPVSWPEAATMSVAYEDLPIGGGNDWDYNDFVVDLAIDVTPWGLPGETWSHITEISFGVVPQAKLAGYTHMMHIQNVFGCDGVWELNRGGALSTGTYDDTTGFDDVMVWTGSPESGSLTVVFDAPCPFAFPDAEPGTVDGTYHGENLFFDPYLYVINTGEEIHTGDPRMLVVPVDWTWPTPDGTPVWTIYTDVAPGDPPAFVPYWWTS